MSVTRKDLGAVTAYAYAVAHGYTGTEEEFAEEQAGFAEAAQQVAADKTTVEAYKNAAVSAKDDAVAAKDTAVQTVENGVEDIEDAADEAVERISQETGAVLYGSAQTLTDGQKTQARANIGAADAGSVAAKLDKTDVFAYTEQFVETDVSTFSRKFEHYSGTVTAQNVSLGVNNSYDSYAFYASADTEVYVNTQLSYYALCIGSSPSGDWRQNSQGGWLIDSTDNTRYRKSDSNLPDSENPLTISAGSLIVITVPTGEAHKIFVKKEIPEFSADFRGKITKLINKITVEKTSSIITLTSGKYCVKFQKKATTQGYQWNITYLSGGSGKNNVIPSGTDIIGVLQFDASLYEHPNFMGGVHGNEDVFDFKVLSNGGEVEDGGEYETITVVMNSHLYDIEDTADNVVDRYVEMIFGPCGWESCVAFKVLVSKKIQVAYPSGLFGFYTDDVSAAYTNVGNVDLSATGHQFDDSPMKRLCVNFTGNITVSLTSDTGDFGFITYRESSESYKIYWSNATLREVAANSYITGKCRYDF